jgi:hypothetical protein
LDHRTSEVSAMIKNKADGVLELRYNKYKGKAVLKGLLHEIFDQKFVKKIVSPG